MATEDALAAAKVAALRDLTQLGEPRPSRRSRRRTRRRPRARKSGAEGDAGESAIENGNAFVAHRSAPPGVTDVPASVEYVPETVDAVVQAQKQPDSEAAVVSPDALDEIASVLKRFAERSGGDGPPVEGDYPDPQGNQDANKEHPGQDTDAQKEEVAKTGEIGAQENVDREHERTGTEVEKEAVISRKQRKEKQRHLISTLKSLSEAPQVVDSWDITAPDPLLLAHLKAWPNSVPVPVNWRQKRKYLQNKRGLEKRAFQLPAYIFDTGVGELRDAQLEADEKKSLKQRQREKMRAKTGRGVEIDHSRLHDAFFKFQVKPRLTGHGDIYYELRELEVDGERFRPAVMSKELKDALGLKQGDPPPWLVNMQRYGPPPGYPGLRVPGVNAPIPAGASYGYQPGGWGKPAVDANGQPIYGDVFGEGLEFGRRDQRFDLDARQKARLWGEMKAVNEEQTVSFGPGGRDDDSGEDEDAKKEAAERANVEAAKAKELAAKRAREAERELASRREGEVRKGVPEGRLYHVLEQRKVSVEEGVKMGSSHVYNVRDGAANDGAEREQEGGEKRRRDAEKDAGDARRAPKKQKEFKF